MAQGEQQNKLRTYRAQYRINPNPSYHRQNSTPDQSYIHSKKGYSMETHFRDRKFSGSPEQLIDTITQGYETCDIQQCLNQQQMSMFFVSALEDPSRQCFLANCNSQMEYSQIIAIMRRHFNSVIRKIQLQSDVDSLELGFFMRKHHINDQELGLIKLIDRINVMAAQFLRGFGDDHHKTRYLRRAVIGHE